MGRSQNATAKILIFFLCLISSICIAAENNKMEEKNAIKTLETASRVESRFVGEGGKQSKIYQAFDLLSSKQNAGELFKEIHKNATGEAGKIYSLIWFFNNDKDVYNKYKEKYLDKKITVETRISDISCSFDMDDIFQKIENGELYLYLDMTALKKTKKPDDL